MASIRAVHRCAICLRISMFLLNACVWLGSLFAILCGLMVGFSNGTFSLDAQEDDYYDGGEIRWRDALFTTPATLLIYYGTIMLVTAIFGCFAGAGGRRCCNITFVIFIIITVLFDLIFGYLFYWNPLAMRNFINNLDASMDSYGVKDEATFGVIPYHPTDYWDHVQRTGSCCGKFDSEEWKTKKIGSEKYDFSLPDSCCTKDYDYRRCGWRIWKHMEGDMDHYRSQILKKMGCVAIFPEEITTKYHEIAYIVIILGLFMILCGICAIVLLVLTCTKKYKAGQGPQQLPRFARAARVSVTPDTGVDEKDSEVVLSSRQVGSDEKLSTPGGRRLRRVHPTTESDTELEMRRRSNPSLRPIIRKRGTEKRNSNNASTHHIFVNQDFGASSEIEELPVVYRGQAEARLTENEYRTRANERREEGRDRAFSR